jgi:hypothetical protein
MSDFPSPLELAESITRDHARKPGAPIWDYLVGGIRAEQQRLGRRPYLSILWQLVLDLDGYDGFLHLGESFDNPDRAHAFIVTQLEGLLAAYTAPNRRHPWRQELERFVPWVSKAGTSEAIQICHEERLSLTADDYINRIYFRAQVLGPFPGAVVGQDLLAMLAGTLGQLESHMFDAGQAKASNRPRRTPLQASAEDL